MVRSSGPALLGLPLFLIACSTISGEKRGVKLSSGHSLRSSRLTIRFDRSLGWGIIEVNCLVKAVAISRLRVRVLEEMIGTGYGTFSIEGLEHTPQA